jgi:hypothetical protein
VTRCVGDLLNDLFGLRDNYHAPGEFGDRTLDVCDALGIGAAETGRVIVLDEQRVKDLREAVKVLRFYAVNDTGWFRLDSEVHLPLADRLERWPLTGDCETDCQERCAYPGLTSECGTGT